MPMIGVGEIIQAEGFWTLHKTFGKQFNVQSFEKKLPSGTAAILQYLSSKTVKGIGPKTAAKIVGKFGEKTFEIIENNPEALATVNGITLEKAKEISKEWFLILLERKMH
jgi:exodeoxyribonuclease V alpha subunit